MTLTEARAQLREYLEDVRLLSTRVGTVDENDILPALYWARVGVRKYSNIYAAIEKNAAQELET